MSKRLSSLILEGIGPFARAELRFGAKQAEGKANVHILTGENGSGKSTVLLALAQCFQQSMKEPVVRRIQGDDALIQFEFDGKIGYHAFTKDKNWSPPKGVPGSGNSRHSAEGHYHTRFPEAVYKFIGVHQGPGIHRGAAFAYSGQRTFGDITLDVVGPVSPRPLSDSLSFEKSIRPDLLVQWIANNLTQRALALADADVAEAEVYALAVGRIAQFITDVCDLEVEFRLLRSPFRVALKIDGSDVPLDVLPDGVKSMLGWVGDMMMRLESLSYISKPPRDYKVIPTFLFLDEIDIHLHPRWQRLILPAVQKLLPNAEVFVSTHSPFVVGSVSDAWIYRLPSRGSTGLTIDPTPSAGGKSYSVILKEVFSVADEFDPQTEALFDNFYQLRDAVYESAEPCAVEQLLAVAHRLSTSGEEPSAIVARELRQISRRTGIDFG